MSLFRDLGSIMFNKFRAQMEPLMLSSPQTALSNQYSLDLSVQTNFVISTEDSNNKAIVFTNIPGDEERVLGVSILVNYQHAITITFPTNVIWKDTAPTFEVGKRTEIFLVSPDAGTTWLGSWATGWPIA